MRIELNRPYSDDWRLGYLRTSPDGRKRVDLFNTNSDRTTVSYSRYLMACKEGRYLSDNEEVDHKDTDCTNDDIDNLQILSIEEHRLKTSNENTGRSFITLSCSYCGTVFDKELRIIKSKPNQLNHFCSRSCNGKFYWSQGFNKN